jgi:agmatine deiminase
LQENLERLRGLTDLEGGPLTIVELPMPAPVLFHGQRLPASYANFYIANDRVLVPTFNDPSDRQALNILASVFPDRQVVGIHAVDLVWGLGTLHCLTQQQPSRLRLGVSER